MVGVHLFAALLAAGIFTLWMPQRWALTSFHLALFGFAIWRILSRIRTKSDPISIHPVGAIVASVAAWGFLQAWVGWTVDRQRTLEEAVNWIGYAAAFGIGFEIALVPEHRDRFLHLFLWFGAGLGVLAMLTVFSSPLGLILWRWDIGTHVPTMGPFTYRNQYATFVESLLPVVLVGALVDRARGVLYAAIAAILFASVVAGGSRTGTLLCLAEIVIVPGLAWRRGLVSGSRAGRVLGGSLIALLLMTAAAGWQFVWKRLQEPNPYNMRAQLVRSSVEMFRERPLTGFGLGTWAEAYPGYARFDDGSRVNQAHNDWAQWAVEGGVLVVVLLAVVAIKLSRPAVLTVWGLGIMFVFAHAFVDYPFQQRPQLSAFFFALTGVVAAANSYVAKRNISFLFHT